MEKDYERLIAAQNESQRRIKIKSINNVLNEENKRKTMYAIATGACVIGTVAAYYFSGIDPSEALQKEIEGLNSWQAIGEYFATFTPAMYGTIAATATSIAGYLKAKRKYDKANQEFYDITDNEPVIYQDIVESQAKNR